MNARPMMVTQQTVRNLALGDKFFLRVAAVSLAGAGPPAVLDQPVHIRETIGKAHPLICCPQLSQALYLTDGETEASGQSGRAVTSLLPHTRA